MALVYNSTSAFYERSKLDIRSLRSRAEGLQQQVGSGQRLTSSSDDPVAASRLRTLARADRMEKVDTTNANRAAADLTLADAALSSFADFLTRARELAIKAGNDTLTDDQRAAIGYELEQIHGNLVQIANSRDSAGHALFGGETTGDAYTLDSSGNAVYGGTGSSGELSLGDGQTVTRGLTGPQFLEFDIDGTPTDIMATIKGLATALQGTASDPAQAARDALGALNAGIDAVTTGQTLVGTRLAWIDLTTERRANLSELQNTEKADIGGTDIASTVAELQELMVILEASQASFGRLAGLSLFNQLR
ncbi:MAG TPA: flagellar hook-associated protein FlgL [Novosphingobium sp.]|nr:flagellar hook-associated protein FlgL [Novosphingobium sp.]